MNWYTADPNECSTQLKWSSSMCRKLSSNHSTSEVLTLPNTKSEIRIGTNQDKPTRTSTKIQGVSCSCGQLCKNFRGLKLHQMKAKCQASENKLTGPDKRCFVSLTDILNTSFLKFGDTIYSKRPSNTFVPICNFDKPISANPMIC